MKRAVIVHCWGGTPDYAWYPWAKQELEKRGYRVTVPLMPDTDRPQLSAWLPHLAQAIGAPDEELLLIGHSLGTVTIMRYLEALPGNQRVGNVIFVAGFTDQLGFRQLENFFENRLDYARIRPKAASFTAIQSDNDPYVSAQYGQRLKQELGAEIISKHNAGHMSGPVDGESPCVDLPELLAIIESPHE